MRHLITILSFALPTAAISHPAVIEDAQAKPGSGGWTISVTISHPETGWDDYADGWRVVSPDGTVLGTRVLAHPHENEQPFTRSLSGVEIPDGVTNVKIESRTKVDGWSGEVFEINLP